MVEDNVSRLTSAISTASGVEWPAASVEDFQTFCVVELELYGSSVRLVRKLMHGAESLAGSVTWSTDYGTEKDASDAFDALSNSESKLQLWSVGATAFGPAWLTPTLVGMIATFIDDREEKREALEREERQRKEAAEREAAEATSLDAYFRKREDRYLIDLQKGTDENGVFWSIGFDEAWERDRFWDWLGWRTERYEEFAEYLTSNSRLDLERLLLREMLVVEQTVKKQGFGSGGRRPLRFWRGEL